MKGLRLFLIIQIISFVSIFSCKKQSQYYSKKEIIGMLKSNNTDTIMIACDYITIHKDTTVYEVLINSPLKGGISHNLNHYGLNGYMARMNTLRTLTGKIPPNKIRHIPDSLVVDFYRKLVLKK